MAPGPVLFVAMLAAPAAGAPSKIEVGAVRWDAWFGSPPGLAGIVGRTVTSDMSPTRYHSRLPFFAKEHPFDPQTNSTVTVNGNSDDVMTAEINYAATFGIDFWAFCAYPIGCADYNPTACPMIQCCAANYRLSYALELYLANPQRERVKFALILQTNGWYPGVNHGGNETMDEEADRFVSYFRMSNHQTCCGGRPVVYVLGGLSDPSVKTAIMILVNKTQKAIGVSPYIVSMSGKVMTQNAPISAYSRYVVQSNPKKLAGEPYQTGIAQPEIDFWQTVKSAGAKLIPSITPGWDPSPREYIDLPWGDQGHKACVEALGHPCYVQDPTMAQLTAHTRDAVEFALSNPSTVESHAVIVGAWNENDEGHWIIPSLYNGTLKLSAIREGVRQAHENNKDSRKN